MSSPFVYRPLAFMIRRTLRIKARSILVISALTGPFSLLRLLRTKGGGGARMTQALFSPWGARSRR